MKEWVVKINWLRSIEESIHRSEDSIETYNIIWGKWLEFKKSMEYVRILEC